ncbi:helix-turn-helix transcriptional regulator [Streptacidiphilus fuscans]|uniref:PAS domain-containing protein n=1 Tax=Streptacidiphilus fuscans TaxID=2789292 RepID=A0A931B9D6_9ACTN|nr:LuxR C-terminal-related transcriptional regulator [Streptacidiphilus fuscans]MBF9073660.1 PAS domain-containing protein [Streptacidiphilus fuscans]
MHDPGQQPDLADKHRRNAPDTETAVLWRNRTAVLFDRVPLPLAFCDAHGWIHAVNPMMAVEWGTLPGRLVGRNATELFQPTGAERFDRIIQALRLRRSARYPIDVTWTSGSGAERHGELTIDLIRDTPESTPNLLLFLRAYDDPAPPGPAKRAGIAEANAMEARILALAATGLTSARIATEVGLTADGVNYHLTRLSRRWGVSNRTALIARAYVKGVLAPDAWPPAPASAPPGDAR